MNPASSPSAAALAGEVSFHAQRGRGPGGQNVNKVASAVLLTWDYAGSALLDDTQKSRLSHKLAASINSRGEIQLRSDEFRDQERNKARALEKLAERVAAALFVPKKRTPTRPTKASRLRRLEGKVQRSRTKKMRGKVDLRARMHLEKASRRIDVFVRHGHLAAGLELRDGKRDIKLLRPEAWYESREGFD